MSTTPNSTTTLELTATSSTTYTPFVGSGSIGSRGELQNLQAAYRLNGKNYLKWFQLIRTFLKGKGKLSHLLGTGSKEGDPMFSTWDEEDALVMSWLWNSMVPEISDTVMFLPTAKNIWEAVNLTYSKVKDVAPDIRNKDQGGNNQTRGEIHYRVC